MKNKGIKILISVLAFVLAILYPAYSLVNNKLDQDISEISSYSYNEESYSESDLSLTDEEINDSTDKSYIPTQSYSEVTEAKATEAQKYSEYSKQQTTKKQTTTTEAKKAFSENGSYYSKDEVALYLHTYGHLPYNFITKKEARNLGWEGGSVERYAPGKAIGGDYYGNYEGTLPQKKGLKYYECDIDTLGKSSRGAKRIIFSNQGDVYYTSDHYETFTKLY